MKESYVNNVPGQGDRPAGTCNIRLGNINVGSMSGRANEVVEMLTRRKVDVCCLQETRWRGGSARKIEGKDSLYKFFWSGDKSGFGGVGVMLAEKWIEAVLSVKRLNHRCMQIRFLVGTVIINVISCYAPQAGLSAEEKDEFYEQMINLVSSVPDEEMLLIGGDLNGHVGENTAGFEDVHGGHGYGNQNPDGVRILDFCLANKLAVGNTFFKKCANQLITYSSGGNSTQIDYILVRRSRLKNVKNINAIGSEECVTQHRLLVCDLVLRTEPAKSKFIPPRRKTWMLNDDNTRQVF